MAAPLGAKHKTGTARLTIRGPLAASAGQPLPIHLNFANISADQNISFVENCAWSNPTWDVRDRGGNKFLYPSVELGCNASTLNLGPTVWHEWTVDPSRLYRLPKAGTYFFTAMFSYKLKDPKTKTETQQTVVSNTILINIR
jgi:hypothetical protein